MECERRCRTSTVSYFETRIAPPTRLSWLRESVFLDQMSLQYPLDSQVCITMCFAKFVGGSDFTLFCRWVKDRNDIRIMFKFWFSIIAWNSVPRYSWSLYVQCIRGKSYPIKWFNWRCWKFFQSQSYRCISTVGGSTECGLRWHVRMWRSQVGGFPTVRRASVLALFSPHFPDFDREMKC